MVKFKSLIDLDMSGFIHIPTALILYHTLYTRKQHIILNCGKAVLELATATSQCSNHLFCSFRNSHLFLIPSSHLTPFSGIH